MDIPGFKTILCPVDYCELSADALRHANLLVLGTTALRAVRHAPYPVFDGEWSRKVR